MDIGDLQATYWPGGQLPSDGHMAWWSPDPLADPGEAIRELGLPAGELADLPTVLPASPRARKKVMTADIPARVVPLHLAVRALAALPPATTWPGWHRPSDSIIAWSVAAKLALELTTAGQIVPRMRSGGPGTGVAYWQSISSGDGGRLSTLAESFPPAAHALLRDDDDETIWPALEMLRAFCDGVADSCVRAAATAGTPIAAATSGSRRRDHATSRAARWASALTGPDPVIDLTEQDIDEIARWSAPRAEAPGQANARLCLQLHTPQTDATDDPWPVEFHLQAADDPSLMVPAEDVWSVGATSMRLLGRDVDDPQESLVRGLAEAARLFPPIDACLSESRPERMDLPPEQAAELLAHGAHSLASAGLGVLLPAELTSKGAQKLRARLKVSAPVTDPGAGITSAGLDAERLSQFSWEAAIGDETLTAEEFAQIVALKQPLVRWKGQWIRVDADDMPKLTELVGQDGQMAGAEALAIALSGTHESDGLGAVDVVVDEPFADLLDRLRDSPGSEQEPDLTGIEATLRDYQRRGVAWLQLTSDLGLGTLLADDMGLGKTLQTISLLAARQRDRPHLVVCPTSVVGNWERELRRFAPTVPVTRHHGSERSSDPDELTVGGSVVITSYGLLRRDADLLTSVDWDVVVLDEAQQIKNHAAQSARAARKLAATTRVALTGTPMENRLSELWSIMDFTNPGLLGPFQRFRERFAVPVERWRDPDATAQLRKIVAPFMLRRVKTDPAVAADLPAKQEAIVTCALTREQATLYEATVRTLLDDEGLGEGIERRGRVLKLLTALKQICNHPAQYLDDKGQLRGRSGKLTRATEMLAEVASEGEHALVFTQYREMGEILARHLCATLNLPEVPFLHGGIPRSRRDAMVQAFQNDHDAPPVLIVSLKAGGTGLNLTRATHVMHYDRWWNPAVEDQATDRAYRIGQSRTVNVHKIVTEGTLEERIADVLEDKRALADAVVGTGETWLTELGDDDLRALVELSPGSSGEAGYAADTEEVA